MRDGIMLPLICVVAIALVGLLIWAGVQDEKAWQTYQQIHHCRVVGQKDSSVGYGIDYKGRMVTTINPEQKIYGCDGGEIRIR